MTLTDPATVSLVMHPGVLEVSAEAPLRLVAQIMAEQRVHALVVHDEGRRHAPVALVTALDVAAAVATGLEPTAGEMAGGEVVRVDPGDPIGRAAQLMTEHDVAHLVVGTDDSRPVGLLSSLDVARFYGR